jgi:hypothetical protein
MTRPKRTGRLIWLVLNSLTIVGFLALESFAQPSNQPTKASGEVKLPPLIEEALWWLPEDTQTVIVDQGKSKLRNPDEEPETFNLAGPEFLDSIQGGDLGRKLAGTPTRLILEGSRKLRRRSAAA